MSLLRLWAISRKEFIQIWRDPRSLAMAIAIPMLMLLLFGFALTLDVDNVQIAVWDQSNATESRELISHFDGSRYFTVASYATNYRQIEALIDEGKILAALVIPRNFAAQITKGNKAAIQFIIDGSDANTATIASSYAEAITLSYSRQLTLIRQQRLNPVVPRQPLDARSRVWFNPTLQSKNYIIPGLIAMIMMVIAALLTSLTVAREWERGTMEQLVSTPIKTNELILGKLIPYFVIGMIDVLIAMTMAQFLFRVPLRGSAALVLFLASIFLVGALSLGILISIMTKNQLLANQLAMILTYLPSFLLSGLMFSLSNMPRPIQIISYFVPARYFMNLLRSIYLKGLGITAIAFEAVLLTVFAGLVLLIANFKFRKKLE